ncbi:MAG: hypothetical protein WCR21_01365 [Bacteroidota bacterium]
MLKQHYIKTKINEKWIDEQGIVWMKAIEGVHMDIEALKEDHERSLELADSHKILVMYDARSHFTISPEARSFLTKGILNENRIATAVLSPNLGVRLLVNFMNTIHPPKSPLKMFSNEEDAMRWLSLVKERTTVKEMQD